MLGHLPPEMVTRLITAFFAQLARQVSEGDGIRATQFGNQIVLLPDALWVKFVPDIPPLLASYATLQEHDASGAAEQVAWVVSRAGLGHLVAELGSRLAAAADAKRVAIVSLLERAICYRALGPQAPLRRGLGGAADVLPPRRHFSSGRASWKPPGQRTWAARSRPCRWTCPTKATPRDCLRARNRDPLTALSRSHVLHPAGSRARSSRLVSPNQVARRRKSSKHAPSTAGGEYRLEHLDRTPGVTAR